jgi:hypothetical protein
VKESYIKTGPTFEASIFWIYSTAECDSKSRNEYLVVRIPNGKSSILTDLYVGFLIPYRQIPEHYPDYIKTVYFHVLSNSSFDIHPTIDEILTASYNKPGVNKVRKPGVAQATRLSMVTPNALSIITAVCFLIKTCISLHASNSNRYITARFTGSWRTVVRQYGTYFKLSLQRPEFIIIITIIIIITYCNWAFTRWQ